MNHIGEGQKYQGRVGFKTTRIESEFKTLIHPKLRFLLVSFAHWSATRTLPDPVVTCLTRTLEENAKTYLDTWRSLRDKYVFWSSIPKEQRPDGKVHFGTLAQFNLAMRLQGRTDEQLLLEARSRGTLHETDQAADLRTRHYSQAQLVEVEGWFRRECVRGEWELKSDLHGSGPHIHIGVLDEGWRLKRLAQLLEAQKLLKRKTT